MSDDVVNPAVAILIAYGVANRRTLRVALTSRRTVPEELLKIAVPPLPGNCGLLVQFEPTDQLAPEVPIHDPLTWADTCVAAVQVAQTRMIEAFRFMIHPVEH